MTQFFTADEHHLHKNIIRHCSRPFKNIDIMSKTIIDNANTILAPGDVLYHIGDWAWGGGERKRLFESLMVRYKEGVIHHLILGNHDSMKPFDYVDIGFSSVHTALKIRVGERDAYLVHDPSCWTVLPTESILLCGHVHGLFKTIPGKRVLNVGVDISDFFPLSENEVLSFFEGEGL